MEQQHGVSRLPTLLDNTVETGQPGAPCLATLPANTLHDIASRVDGHDLLSLLATCRDLHDSAALKACLIDAALQQVAALQAALLIMVPALVAAQSVVGRTAPLLHALAGVAVQMGSVATFDLVSWRASLDAHRNLVGMIEQARPEHKLAAMVSLVRAKVLLRRVQAAGPAGQQAPAAGQTGQQAPAVGQPGQPEQQAAGQLAQAGGQQLGPMVSRARREAVEALQLVEPGQPAEQAEAAASLAMQAALHSLLAGQQQAVSALHALQQGRAQQLKQCARQTLQQLVQQGLEVLQGGSDDEDHVVRALQEEVHRGQAVLQQLQAD